MTDTEQKTAVCPHCKSTDFTVYETSWHKASADDADGNTINCHQKGSYIESIECDKCSADITLDIIDLVEFNFN